MPATPTSDQQNIPSLGAPAWTDRELVGDPHANAEKPDKVRRMFSAIAPAYDLNNRLHSLWRDQAWRRFAVRRARVAPGDLCLDIACGTGDLTELLAASSASRVIGVDFTPRMLEIARAKIDRRAAAVRAKVEYEEGDASALRFPDAFADVLTIAFGIRNVSDPGKAVREFARVLKPGGRLVILEFDRPTFLPARWLNDFYCGWVMPRTATWISRDRSGAYKYLPKSVGAFMSRGMVVQTLGMEGFTGVRAIPLTLGICVCYVGVRAE
jgi:demethylmenaquinone methyltransferase/2-methoxy-6-polyprenyl-1,4-benzoquinol methylase